MIITIEIPEKLFNSLEKYFKRKPFDKSEKGKKHRLTSLLNFRTLLYTIYLGTRSAGALFSILGARKGEGLKNGGILGASLHNSFYATLYFP